MSAFILPIIDNVFDNGDIDGPNPFLMKNILFYTNNKQTLNRTHNNICSTLTTLAPSRRLFRYELEHDALEFVLQYDFLLT